MSALELLQAAPASSGGGGSKSPVVLLVIGLVFIVVGGLQGANPRLLWQLTSGATATRGE